MTDVPHPFAPFSPSPPIAPTVENQDRIKPQADKPAKKQNSRKPKVIMGIPVVSQVAAAPPAVEKPARKPRSPNKPKALKAHSPKFDLQTTLAAAQLLNEGDFPLFEKLVVMLDEAGKPARDRVLGALSKVFG